MAGRRWALGAVAMVVVLALPGCRFSRTASTALPSTSSTESTVTTIGLDDVTTSSEDTSSTTAGATPSTTAGHAITTVRSTTKTTTRTVTTVRKAAPPSGPHCTVSVPYSQAYVGLDETITVNSNLPNSPITVRVDTAGSVYSSSTDGSGTYQKNQHVNQAMAHKTTHINVDINGRASCSTSFTVS